MTPVVRPRVWACAALLAYACMGAAARAAEVRPWAPLQLDRSYSGSGVPPAPAAPPNRAAARPWWLLAAAAGACWWADRRLRRRLDLAVRALPWPDLRDDPRIRFWPRRPLPGRLALLPLLRDLSRLRDLQRLGPGPGGRVRVRRRTAARCLRRLASTRCGGEARLLLRILAGMGHAAAAEPALDLLRRLPEDPVLPDEVAGTLTAVARADLLVRLAARPGPPDRTRDRVLHAVLARRPEQGARALLAELEQSTDPRVRRRLLELLAPLGRPEALGTAARSLVRGPEAERTAAAGVLAVLSTPEAADALVQGICQNSSSRVRHHLARTLARIPGPAPAARLAEIARRGPSAVSRARAVEAMAALDHPDPALLRRLLSDRAAAVRTAAARVLEQHGEVDRVLAAYLEQYRPEAQAFLVAAGRGGALRPLIRSLSRSPAKGIKRAARLLADVGNRKAVPYLVECLERTPDWTVESRLIQALARLQAREAVPLLVERLRSRHRWVRKSSLDALARLLSPRSALRERTLVLVRRLLQDPDPWARAGAARLLGRLGDTAAVPAIMELARDPMTRVRMEAAAALKRLAPEPAQEVLLDLLHDRRDKVAAVASAALAAVGCRKALPALFARFHHAGPLLRVAVLEAVRTIDPTEAEPLVHLLREDTAENLRTVRLLGRAAMDPTDVLAPLARSGRTRVRCEALRGLALCGDPRGRALIFAMMRHKDPALRSAAVDAAALTGDPALAGALNERRSDPDRGVRLRAILGLGLVKNPDALPFLRNSLYHTDPAVRAHALLALFHYGEPHFLEFFLDQFREIKVRNLLRRLLRDRGDPVAQRLAASIPEVRRRELTVLREHTLKSLDTLLEEWITAAADTEDRLWAVMVAEFLRRRRLKAVLKRAARSDPMPQVRARALKAYAEMADMRRESALIQEAVADPALEVQTVAARCLARAAEPVS